MESIGSLWDLQDGFEAAVDPPLDTLTAEILDVVARHRDGIRARDVGNALGVDWRRVVAVVSLLVDEGLVEQIQQRLYSVAKASGRC